MNCYWVFWKNIFIFWAHTSNPEAHSRSHDPGNSWAAGLSSKQFLLDTSKWHGPLNPCHVFYCRDDAFTAPQWYVQFLNWAILPVQAGGKGVDSCAPAWYVPPLLCPGGDAHLCGQHGGEVQLEQEGVWHGSGQLLLGLLLHTSVWRLCQWPVSVIICWHMNPIQMNDGSRNKVTVTSWC